MQEYSVPQREVQVQVHLLDGRDLDGVTYVPEIGPDGGPGHLIDRLNEENEEFIALRSGSKTHLVHETRILTVQISGDDVEEQIEREIEQSGVCQNLLVKIHMISGLELIGQIAYVMPPEKARLRDYLNTTRRFMPMVVKETLTYVNRSQIVSVLALRGEENG